MRRRLAIGSALGCPTFELPHRRLDGHGQLGAQGPVAADHDGQRHQQQRDRKHQRRGKDFGALDARLALGIAPCAGRRLGRFHGRQNPSDLVRPRLARLLEEQPQGHVGASGLGQRDGRRELGQLRVDQAAQVAKVRGLIGPVRS